MWRFAEALRLSRGFAFVLSRECTAIGNPVVRATPQSQLDHRAIAHSGRARMKWGDHLEFVAEAGPGDFIYVPPYVPHQEINASDDEPLSCVLVRSGQEPVVVNLDLPNVEPNPEEVHWVDNIHPAPKA